MSTPNQPVSSGFSSWIRKGITLPVIGPITLGSAILILGIGFVLFRRKSQKFGVVKL